MKKPPVMKTREQVQRDLLIAMRGILGSGVTSAALDSPSDMTSEDIVANLHLYERLGTAFMALAALKGYKPDFPRGFSIQGDN